MTEVLDLPTTQSRSVAEPSGVRGADEVLTQGALDFLAELHERFDGRRRDLLGRRAERQARFDAGELPDFPEDTREIREAEWTVGSIPADLLDRRVEITGPTNAKMVINALNSGAKVFMADFEDATSPMWDELLQGQLNLAELLAGPPALQRSGQREALRSRRRTGGADGAPARLAFAGRPCDRRRCGCFRHVLRFRALPVAQCASVAGEGLRARISTYPSSRAATRRRCGATSSPSPRSKLRLERGTIKATVLIETFPAAFEMDEILYALKREYRRAQLWPLGLYLFLHQAARPLRPTG